MMMKSSQVSFVVCGNFGPTRGFERLLANWLQCPNGAVLYLQGKDNEFKEHLKNLKTAKILLQKNALVFIDAVPEEKIIESLKSYDVGIIPYEPFCLNNKYCFPNKTTQYLKAGLPILANDLPVIKRVFKNTGAGLIINFKNTKLFRQAILLYTNTEFLRKAKVAALKLHENHLNWEKVSQKFYETLETSQKVSHLRNDLNKSASFSKNQYIFTEQIFLSIAQNKKYKKKPFIEPYYNSRQLTNSLTCLFIAKCIFYFWIQLLKNNPLNYPKNILNAVRPARLKYGVFERYDSIVKRRLSPI